MPTAIVKSIGSRVGRDYATPQAFEDAIPSDITAAGTNETWTGECYNDSEFTTGTTFSGTSADVTHWIKLTTATGQSFIDHADKLTNALTYDQTKGVAINVSGSYTNGIRLSNAENITIEKLQINRTNASGNNRAIFADGTGANKLVQNVIVKTSESGSEGIQIYGGKVNNTLIICTATNTTGLFLRNGSEAHFVTVVSPSDVTSTVIGIDGQYTNNIVKNCVSFGFGTDFESGVWAAASDYNASDGTGSPGANSVDSLTFADQFEVVTTTGMDFRAKSGNDLQAGVADLTLDIIGQTRADPPTIGAFEFVSGGGGGGTTVGSFDSTSNSTTSFTGSLSLSGAFASVNASTVSFNGAIDNSAAFSSTTASAFSANGTLTLNGSFRSRSNLLSHSEYFSNWSGSSNGAIVTADSINAPYGTHTADLLDDNSATGSLRIYQTVLVADDSNSYVYSVYLKQATATHTLVKHQISDGSLQVDNEAVIDWDSPLSVSGSGISIEDEGDGWYRLSISLSNNSTGNVNASVLIWPANYPSVGVGSVYAWGAQLEEGSVATAYDKTPATTSSFNGSLTSYGSFASVAASATSFNGSIVNQFSSVASSTASFSGTLTLNALFSTTTASAASFNGSLAGTNAGVFSTEATTSASFNGSLFSYSSLSSVSTSAFSASGSIDSSAEFNSAALSSLSLSGHIEQFGTFASVSTSSFNIFNEEPPTPSKRVISSSASNRTISSTSNRVITTH
jgi:hypothetical protein